MKALCVIAIAAGCGGAATLVDAIQHQPYFPSTDAVLLPLSSESPLGWAISVHGRTATRLGQCFQFPSTSVKSGDGLAQLTVAYTATKDMQAEIAAAAAAAHVDLSDTKTATAVFGNITTYTGLGVPDMTGQCTAVTSQRDGTAENDYFVVTEYTKAQTAKASFVGSSKIAIVASGGMGVASGKLKAGWVSSEQNEAAGSNLVLTVGAQEVRVRIGKKTYPLGPSIQVSQGKSYSAPDPLSVLVVTLDHYVPEKNAEVVRVSGQLPGTAKVPDGWADPSQPTPIAIGDGQHFIMPMGNAALLVRLLQDPQSNDLRLELIAYRTTSTDGKPIALSSLASQ